MSITAYLIGGVWLCLSNGVEFEINKTLMKKLYRKGVRIHYKYRKEKQ